MGLKCFNAYHSYLKSLEPLSDAERGRLFTALLEYSATGTVPELRGSERILFPMMKEQIDRDREAYEQKCRKNASNIQKRWDTNEYDGIRSNTTEYERMQRQRQGQGQGQGQGEKEKPARAKRFTPPTVEEVEAYCRERQNSVNAGQFCDFYASKGWKVGKEPMKDWKASVRTWERRDSEGGNAEKEKSGNPFLRIAMEEEAI